MLKIIGAGYGRTGTKSMQLALQQLGFGPCYHMEALFLHPHGVKYWKEAYKTGETDWDALFDGYNSIVDFPGGMYYKEMANQYPDAKVILTVRDPEKWYDSVMKTIYSFEPSIQSKLRLLLSSPFSKKSRDLIQVGKLNDASIWKKYFEGRMEDRDYAIGRFNQHIEEVKAKLPADRLLIMDVREGWGPLCDFLNVAIPEGDFPRANSGENFSEWANEILAQSMTR